MLSETGFKQSTFCTQINCSSHLKCNFDRFCVFREESIKICGRSKLTDRGVLGFRFAREIKSVRILALTDKLTRQVCTFKLKYFKCTCTNLQSAGPEKGKFRVLKLERTRKKYVFH